MKNLVTFCKDCHIKLHSHKLFFKELEIKKVANMQSN